MKRKVNVINITPTWGSIFPLLKSMITDGNKNQKQYVCDVVERLCKFADNANNTTEEKEEHDVYDDEYDNIPKVQSAKHLKHLAKEYGVRSDWHEPDEQGLRAFIIGNHLDNAGCGPEYQIILVKDGKASVRINLATLLAFACGYKEVR